LAINTASQIARSRLSAVQLVSGIQAVMVIKGIRLALAAAFFSVPLGAGMYVVLALLGY
jgi:hypothetical protein